MNMWRLAEVLATDIFGTRDEGYIAECQKCKAQSLDPKKRILHKKFCPIVILKYEEESSNGTVGYGEEIT
jgi:hypothetical protein